MNVLQKILSPRQLSELTGLSVVTLWRERRAGRLPEPIRLSPGRIGWTEDQVRDWLASRELGGCPYRGGGRLSHGGRLDDDKRDGG